MYHRRAGWSYAAIGAICLFVVGLFMAYMLQGRITLEALAIAAFVGLGWLIITLLVRRATRPDR